MSILFSYPKSCKRSVKLLIQGHGVGGDLIYFHCLQLLLYQALANDAKNHSFTSLITVQNNVSYFSSGVSSLLATTSSIMCLFIDQNKDYHPEDGFPASITNVI
jgi:hypothetical protein